MRAKFKALIILILFFANIVRSQEFNQLPSLEWQKQNLEDRIRNKVDTVVSKILNSNQYAIDISMTVTDPSDPEWNKSSDDSQGPQGANGADAKTADAKTADEANKEEDKKDPSKEGKVLFQDSKLPNNAEDYIVFSKFGIEAPLVDDYNDFQPDGKIILSMDGNNSSKKAQEEELKKKETELQRKLASTSNKASPMEQAWKYNNAIDVFNNLKSVKILLRASESLNDETKQTLEKYVKGINFNIGKIKPEVIVEYGLLGSDFNRPGLFSKIAEFFEFLSKYATFMGIILGVLLAGLVGNFLIKKFFELNSGTQNSSSMSMEGGDEEDSSDDTVNGAGGGAGELSAENGLWINGVERFQNYVNAHESDAVLVVKKWLRESGDKEKLALKALVQQMGNDSLFKLFKHLSESEKVAWKKLLDQPLQKTELDQANSFISTQIVQDFILPKYITEPETYDLVLRLKAADVVSAIEKNFETGCVLLNAFSIGFINEVLDACDESLRAKVVNYSIDVTPDMIIEKQGKIKELVKGLVKDEKTRPFVDVIRQLIPDANPQYEGLLFDNLFKVASRDEMAKISYENYPSSLLFELPHNFLKSTLSSYPLKRKVNMLITCEDDMKDKLIETFAPAGSKAYDLLNLEFENLNRDSSELAMIKAQANNHWKDFIHYTRAQILKDKQVTSKVREILSNWIDEKFAKTPNRGESHLKMVS